MTNTTMDSQSYPQFSLATATDDVGPVSKFQMNNYRVHPAIQNRPNKMIALEKEEHGTDEKHAFNYSFVTYSKR